MIRKYLIVTLKEDIPMGDQDALSFTTKLDGGMVINVPSQKLAISIADLKEAIAAIEEFNAGQPVIAKVEVKPKSELPKEDVIQAISFGDVEGDEDVL